MARRFDLNFGKLAVAVELLAVVAALAFGLALAIDGHFNTASYYPPTFDNAMLWAGRARVILDTGHYAEMELVFGGVTKTYHVPFWPALTAGFSSLGGVNLYWAVRLVSLLQAVLLGLGVYLAAKAFSGGSRPAGAVAALLAFSSFNLMAWGTRNTPISWGVVLIPFGVWAVASRKPGLAVLAGLSLALDHQPSLLLFVLTLFLYAIFSNLSRLRALLSLKLSGIELAPIVAGITAFFVYLVWHVRQTGFSCLNFSCLPQAAAREFGKSIALNEFLSKIPEVVGALGAAAVALWWLRSAREPNRTAGAFGLLAAAGGVVFSSAPLLFLGLLALLYALRDCRDELLLFAWLAACILLVKNDALGAGVFTERFLTHFDEALAVAGGVLLAIAAKAAAGVGVRTGSREL